jgi:hypothetical protein
MARVRGGYRTPTVRAARGAGPPRGLQRACPRCGAAANQSCFRARTGRINGEDTNGAYDTPLKYPHPERLRSEAS